MEELNLEFLKGTLLSKEGSKDIILYKINTEDGVKEFHAYHYGYADLFLGEHMSQEFYLVTDGTHPLALKSFDGKNAFILNPSALMNNDIYLWNKYRVSRDKLMTMVRSDFSNKKLKKTK